MDNSDFVIVNEIDHNGTETKIFWCESYDRVIAISRRKNNITNINFLQGNEYNNNDLLTDDPKLTNFIMKEIPDSNEISTKDFMNKLNEKLWEFFDF